MPLIAAHVLFEGAVANFHPKSAFAVDYRKADRAPLLLIGGDTLPCKKPDASVLRHVLTEFGSTPGQAAHVGDSETDVAAARNAGVAAWAVPWGYNAGRPVAEAAPDRLFQSMSEITRLVRTLRAAPALLP